jgi:hypothetical protein
MSARKCSSCGQTTKSSVPFCSNCGALFPVGDEPELMRQAIGASFDLKWVIIGALVALVLQLGLLGGLWSVMGKRILVGEKGRSLLEVNLDSISPQWGPNSGGTRVRLTVKPDNDGVNTAQTVMSVMFGSVKAERFHLKHLVVVKKDCVRKCANQVMATQVHLECMKPCDATALTTEDTAVKACKKGCEEVDKDEELSAEKKKKAKARLKCNACDTRERNYVQREWACRKVCPAKKKTADAVAYRCELCKKIMPTFEARAKACRASVTSCWAYKTDQGRKAPPKMPARAAYKTDKAFKVAVQSHNAQVAETKSGNKRSAKRERKQLRTMVNVYTPVSPGKIGHVPVKIIFKSGEELVKHQGFFLVDPKDKDKRPKIEKKKRILHDPVRTGGFWILLIASCFFYFLGGFAVGRASPSIGMKEPLTSGIFAWLAFEAVLFALGTAGSAQMFTMFIGAPAFIGAALIGAALGGKSAEA